MRLIDADVLKHEIETRHDWYDKNDAEMLTMVDKQPTVDVSSVEPTFYGYPIEHLVKIARVMAKASYTPEEVTRMLQNAGEIAKLVHDEMVKMLKECVESICKGEANEVN